MPGPWRSGRETLCIQHSEGRNMSSTDEWRGLPGGAKKSQRNLGLLVANGDLTLFEKSIAK